MNRSGKMSILLVTLFVIFFVILSGCRNNTGEESGAISPTPLLISRRSTTPIIEVASTITPSPTVIQTEIIRPTLQSTHTPTPKALATLEQTEVRNIVDRWFFGDASDLLNVRPIKVGVSTWGETEQFLERFSSLSDPYDCCTISAGIIAPSDLSLRTENPDQLDIYFYMKKGISSSSIIDFIALRRFNLKISDLFKYFGQPTDAFIWVLDTLPINTYADYQLILIYENEGFMISFEGKTNTSHILTLCPDIQQIPLEGKRVILWKPGKVISLDDINSDDFISWFFHKPGLGYIAFEELSKSSLLQFTKAFADEGISCIQIRNPNKLVTSTPQ